MELRGRAAGQDHDSLDEVDGGLQELAVHDRCAGTERDLERALSTLPPRARAVLCRPLAGNRASRGQCSSPRHQQLAQRRAVAVRLIFAVAPYADVAVLRQRGQQVQRVGGIGRLHLGLVVAEERIPVGCALRRVRLLHQLGAG
ncbi:hypothetical protein G6F63_014122 [Rhizopus arrhizus]|nr:hypothetical protein G6F63_014122 [Rhizopus arrhizus]